MSVSSVSCNHEEASSLTASEDFITSWIEAIKGDNVEEVEMTLGNLDRDTQMYLLNQPLSEWKIDPCGHKNCDCYHPDMGTVARYTTYIALEGPSMKVLDLLQQSQQVDFLQKNANSLNIIQSLIYFSYYRKCQQDQYVNCYHWLCKTLPKETLKQLLKEETPTGMNCLEFALCLDRFPFFTAIINTEGIYLIKHKSRMYSSYKWYDITDYEHPKHKRFGNSPLLMISLLDHKNVSTREGQKLLSSPLVTTWVRKKIQTFRFHVYISVIHLVLQLIGVFLMFNATIIKNRLFRKENATNGRTNFSSYSDEQKHNCLPSIFPVWTELIILVLIFFHSLLLLCVAVVCVRRFARQVKLLCKRPGHTKKPAVDPLFYIHYDILLHTCILVKIISASFGYTCARSIPSWITHGTDLLIVLSLLWCVLYFFK